MKAHIPHRLALALLLLLPGAQATAEDNEETRWYEVQLLVFEHLSSEGEERWPAAPRLPDTSEAQTIGPTAETRTAWARSRAPDEILPAHWDRLKNSDNYRPLLRVAWVQPGQPRDDDATAVRIHDDKRIETDSYSGPWGFTMEAAPEAEQGPVYQIDGLVTVTLGRYLHLHPQLVLTRKPEEEDVEVGQSDNLVPMWMEEQDRLQRYVLEENRRMRSNELHYIDHPRFGILARIDRVED